MRELETFAKTWDGNQNTLNSFAKQFHQKWGLKPGHGQTKRFIEDLAAEFQRQPANQEPNTQRTPARANENSNQPLNLNNINRNDYYVISPKVARSLGLGSTIVLGGDLRIALADSAGTLSPQVRASLQASIGGLGVGAEVSVGGDTGAVGGLFGGLLAGVSGGDGRGVTTANGPVGQVGGELVYRNAQGRLIYADGRLVPTNAEGQPVDANGQPVVVEASASHSAAGNPNAATLLDSKPGAPQPPTTPAPTTPAPTTPAPTTPAPTTPTTPTTGPTTSGEASVTGSTFNAAAASAAAAAASPSGTATSTTATQGTAAELGQNPGPPAGAPAYGYYRKGGYPVPGGERGGPGRGLIGGLQQLLSQLLGTRVSRGQTQQFINQLSPAALSAFLANPTQPQPGVMSTLMSVVMRDHGRPGKVGRDAMLALFDHLMSRNPSAREVYNFFKSLTPDQVQHLIAHRAEMIGNLPGVPQEVRVAANAQRIEAELTVMQGSRDPAAQRRAQTLEHLLTQNAQILHFDNAPDGRLAAGRISQVFGNLAEAKYVSLMIPGLNNTMDNFSARAQRGQLLHQLAQPMAREGTAMVVWLERLGQEVLRQYKAMLTSWQAREQTRAPMTFQQALAQAARHLAQESVPGMMLRGDARLTFVGHSFGSLIAKESLNQGAKPDACVFLGMPEHRLKKIGAQAGCGDVDLYSMVADGDAMDEAIAADEAPEAAEAAEAAGLDEEIDRLDPGKDLVPPIEAALDPHDNYGLEGSASLAQIVGVTLGWRPKLLPPEPSVITLYRSADGTYEDQAEPVGWFAPKGEEW